MTATDAIDALLPQTQCTRCGFADCRAYAQAIAEGTADINRCPPGGAEGIRRLAAATGRPERPLDPDCGTEGPRQVVRIEEAACIGCTLCIKACPVDCVVGASKHMHTVITADCTGCGLCIPACPVDCIVWEDAGVSGTGWAAWSPQQAERACRLYRERDARQLRLRRENDERLARKATDKLADLAAASRHTDPAVLARKASVVEAAIARARARLQAAEPPKDSA